jgi:hypothetical protein
MIKKIYSIIAVLCFTASVFAQAPQKMSYQAVIRNSSDALVTSTPVGMRISIIQGSIFGASVYVETQTTSTNANGLVSLAIGTGTPVTGTFAAIDWAAGPYFIKTETDPTGGTAYTINGTNELMSVPYALYAKIAESVIGGSGLTHYIGEQFGGGVIFHLWQDSLGVEHGLIVDKTDLGASWWSNVSSTIGTSAQSCWDGLRNSNAIVGQAGHSSSAAAMCLNSTNGGQNDWYLPSVQEINMLWGTYYTVARSLSQITGATLLNPAGYWLSTEYEVISGNARHVTFFSGSISYITKSTSEYVRAIRAF